MHDWLKNPIQKKSLSMKHWQTLNKHEDIKREYKKKSFVQTLFVIPNLVCFCCYRLYLAYLCLTYI